MEFVKGSPIKGEKQTFWYLRLRGQEAQEFVAKMLDSNADKALRNPHAKGSYEAAMIAKTSLELAMGVLIGERDGYFVNRNGGMTPTLYGIVESREASAFPGVQKVSITKWQGGKHFYARIGGLDVEDTRGRTKWNSRRGAMQAARAFAKRNQIELEMGGDDE